MSDTLLRQIEMLRLIPRLPQKVDSGNLASHLEERGYQVNQRTVQRDLEKLMTVLPLTVDTRSKPYGWSWMKDARQDGFPAMNPHTAVMFKVLESHGRQFLPPEVTDTLKPYFDLAEGTLAQTNDSRFGDWDSRIAIAPSGMPLGAPKVDPEVAARIYEALFRQRRFKARYRKRGHSEDEASNWEINPLGLIFKEQITYLVCTLFHYDDLLHLPLHRFLEIELLDTPSTSPDEFSLQHFVESGELAWPVGDMIKLEAWFECGAAEHLIECPLSPDQTVEWEDDWALIKATVQDTEQLRWWLLGFADGVIVEKPRGLKKDIATRLRSASESY